MAWGGLNPALTAWRNGINQRFPKRGTGSDGGYADRLHGSDSQHQPDADGSVDAFDMDVNLLGSANDTGNAVERRLIEALKRDFEADRRSQLWIHLREISNEAVRDWAERHYGGANAHDKHVHWQSDPAHERDGSPWKFTHTDALLRELKEDDMALSADDKKWIAGEIQKAVKETAEQVWQETENIAVKDGEKPNNQRTGSILRYTSSEHHRLEDKIDQVLAKLK